MQCIRYAQASMLKVSTTTSYRKNAAIPGSDPRMPFGPSMTYYRKSRICTRLQDRAVYIASRVSVSRPNLEVDSWDCKLDYLTHSNGLHYHQQHHHPLQPHAHHHHSSYSTSFWLNSSYPKQFRLGSPCSTVSRTPNEPTSYEISVIDPPIHHSPHPQVLVESI